MEDSETEVIIRKIYPYNSKVKAVKEKYTVEKRRTHYLENIEKLKQAELNK